MEVKEIIEYLEKHKPIPLFARSKEDYNEYIGKDIEKIDKMITLLKSLEAENKKYKNILKELEQAMKYIEKTYLGGGELDIPDEIIEKYRNDVHFKHKCKTIESFFINTKSEKDFESIILVVRKLIYEHSRKLKEWEETNGS